MTRLPAAPIDPVIAEPSPMAGQIYHRHLSYTPLLTL